ncbi:MAG: hypothetical protein ACRD4U_06070, partial [Candidatus Acidiferrales bacterium]
VFSSNDPLPPGPLPYADITNPQSLNKYTYTYNNPLRYTDPTGHFIGLGIWTSAEQIVTTTVQESPQFLWQEILGVGDVTVGAVIGTVGALASGQAAEGFNQTVSTLATTPGDIPAALAQGVQTTVSEVASGNPRAIGQVVGTVATIAAPFAKGKGATPSVAQPHPNGQVMVGPNGTAVRIPPGQVAEPAANANGIVYRNPGTTGNANTIRIMGPDAQGRYPSGYVRVYNERGQPINPSTGRPDVRARTHTPL